MAAKEPERKKHRLALVQMTDSEEALQKPPTVEVEAPLTGFLWELLVSNPPRFQSRLSHRLLTWMPEEVDLTL